MWRIVLWTIGLATAGGVAFGLAGMRPGWGVAVSLAISVIWIVVRVTLVRLAHSAFRIGDWGRASWLYWLVGWMLWARGPRMASRVSRAACRVGEGRYDAALALLERVAVDSLDDSARAAWLNNRAYALSRAGRSLDEALSAVTEAVEIRPNLAGFRHTRGVVLVALGRFDEAVRELDEVWKRKSDESALLESERCYDLGMAWRGLGESEYALDYFDRSRRALPGCSWATRAEDAIGQPAAPRASSIGDVAV